MGVVSLLLPRRFSIYLFEVRWNYHLAIYFSLMHRCGINANLLPLTFLVRYLNNLLQNINHYKNI